MRQIITILICGLLAACASVAPEDFYGPPGFALATRDHTLAQCWANANFLPATAMATTNPFFVAAVQQDYVVQCMAASGYRKRT